MINKLITQFEQYKKDKHDEDLYIERLQTKAEGVGAIPYGEDTSHGSATGDRMENATITLAEAREKINARRVGRFTLEVETCGWIYEKLKPQAARVMVMYAIDGFTYREIAEKTGRSVGWVSTTINEAKKLL